MNSNVPKNTKHMVEKVRIGWERYREVYEKLFEAVDCVSESLVGAFSEGNIEKAKEMLRINHGILKSLGVSGEVLDGIVETGERMGIRGKMTGGGGGGMCVFIVTDEDLEPFEKYCEEKKMFVMVADITDQGVVFINQS